MKHLRLVFFFSILLISASAYSQDDKKVRLGLTLNPNTGWLSPDNKGWEGNGLRMGIQYGLYADLRLFGDENYSFSTGFKIAHMGGKLKYNDAVTQELTQIDLPATTDATYKLRYINVPLAIKLRTNEMGYMHYWGVFGSEIGFRIKANADTETTSALPTTKEEGLNIADDIALFRADLVIGGGLEYTISGDTRISVGLVYHNGLTNIIDGNAFLVNNGSTVIGTDGKASSDKELRNRLNYISLNLGVYF